MHRAQHFQGISRTQVKKVIWTPVAKELLKQTEKFTSERWHDEIVTRFLDRLDETDYPNTEEPGTCSDF